MAITPLPAAPSRAVPSTFSTKADAFLGALPTFVTEANALETNVNSKEVSAAASAASALSRKTDAEAAAALAALTVGAAKWVSVTTYAIGNVVWSPTNYLSYRRKTNGAGTTDPSSDTTNWSALLPFSGSTKALAGTDTASAMTPADVNARVAVDVNEKAMTQSVHLTAASSGSSGIQNADNANLNAGTGNFSWTGSVFQMDWTPSANQIIAQKHDGTNGWILTLLTTGVLRLTINATTYDSTIATGFVDATMNKLGFSVTRSSATTAGVVRFAGNKVQIGADVAITAGAPTTVSNAVALYTMGTSAVRTAGRVSNSTFWNRALTIADHYNWAENGIAEADKWGSQTAVYTSDFSVNEDSWVVGGTGTATLTGDTDSISGENDWLKVEKIASNGRLDIQRNNSVPTSIGKRIKVVATIYNPVGSALTYFAAGNGDATTAQSAGILIPADTKSTVTFYCPARTSGSVYAAICPSNAAGVRDDAVAVGQIFYIKAIEIYQTGATLALESDNAQPIPGMWLDSSTNNLHAIYPAAGASLTRPKDSFVIRWVNTWAASHEAQYLGGINQAMLPPKCCITSIVGVIAGSTIEDIILGDGSDTDHWVAITSGLAAGTVNFTIANAFSNLTNYKLVVYPDANFTGSITWTIRGYIYQ